MKTMFRFFLGAIIALPFFQLPVFAQVSVNTDGSAADNSAMLEVKSSNKGFLVPRMTQAEISAIANPANGLIAFCTTDNKFYAYLSSTGLWKELLYGTSAISPPFTCGTSLTINHVAGTVAPVNKTVYYGTVTGIPGEPSKCWITSNLGADHQATAVDDATEASAGWYWQLNRKQGYKHDGTTRTPNTTWIYPISENSDWTAANDPCTIELSNQWHVPTSTEWANVDGGWNDWNGPWGSGLKLHAAGDLWYSDGSLVNRGSYGNYWSSTQDGASLGWYLAIGSSFSFINSYTKAFGFSVRCVRN